MKIEPVDLKNLERDVQRQAGRNDKQAFLYLFVFLFFIGCFFLTNSGVDTSEGVFHYKVAEQIIRHGQLGFDQTQVGIFTTAPNGRSYASHEIGNTLFLLPTAFVNVFLSGLLSGRVNPTLLGRLQEFVMSFHAGVLSAITATTFFVVLKKHFIHDARKSFVATLFFVFTTFFWTYSRNLFDGVLCSMLLMTSFLCLLEYQSKNRKPYLIVSFLLLGIGLITRLSMIVLIIGAFSYLLSSSKKINKWVDITISFSALLPFFLWQAWYNNLRTGIFYKSPVQMPQYYLNNGMDGDLFHGIAGLLISPGKSVFVYAPLLVLSVLASIKFSRKFPRESIYISVTAVLWLLLHAKLKSWYGAAGWGPRHFVTILPILFLPSATYLNAMLQHEKLRFMVWTLGAFGFLLSAASMISNWHFRMMYAIERGLGDDRYFVWDFAHAQSWDMLVGAAGNCIRVITHGAPIVLKDSYSPVNEYVSSTLNFWPNSLLSVGISPLVVSCLTLVPLLLITISGIKILRATRAY
jgi:Dolichyl-phosphate-mannose-protein mannosyltransferase